MDRPPLIDRSTVRVVRPCPLACVRDSVCGFSCDERFRVIRRFRRACVLSWVAFVCAFVSASVCSLRGLFACVLSWVEILC